MTDASFFADHPEAQAAAEGDLDAALDDALGGDEPETADAATAATASEDEDESFDDDDSADEPEPDAAAAPDEPEPGSLEEREQRLAEREAALAQAEQQRQRQESEAYWVQEWHNIHAWKAQQEQAIYARAQAEAKDKAYPDEFIGNYLRQHLSALDAGYRDAIAGYYAKREQGYQAFVAQREIPNFARQIARQNRLGKAETEALLRIAQRPAVLADPDILHEHAAALAESRKAKKAAAARVAQPPAQPGSGRGAGGRRAPRNLNELVDSLF